MANIINADSVEGLKYIGDASNEIQIQSDGANTVRFGVDRVTFKDGSPQQTAVANHGAVNEVLMTDAANKYKSAPLIGGGVPDGAIALWSGLVADIPKYWYLCDGTNGTPNLRDKFIVGAGNGLAIGATGGATDITLNNSLMPSHNHGATAVINGSIGGTTNSVGDHTHSFMALTGGAGAGHMINNGGNNIGGYRQTSAAGGHSHSFSGNIVAGTATINSAGIGQSFNILPPYMALFYIMFKKV